MKKRVLSAALLVLLCLTFLLPACARMDANVQTPGDHLVSLDNVPAFDGKTPYVVLNGNVPDFSSEDLTNTAYESYTPLDALERCGIAMACVGVEIMPTEERGSIGQVKPSGWHTVKYDIVDGKYLYNRCHLIGYQLTGENANKENLITGTRFLNIEGMLPFENMVADYVKETENHVLYRVTPVFEGGELLCRGVVMEAFSVEDAGAGISFHIFAYNAQPGIVIDYATGESHLAGEAAGEEQGSEQAKTYILNTNSKKIHLPDCGSVASILPENRETSDETLEELLRKGYQCCKNCLKDAE